jgi:hypothetical protein
MSAWPSILLVEETGVPRGNHCRKLTYIITYDMRFWICPSTYHADHENKTKRSDVNGAHERLDTVLSEFCPGICPGAVIAVALPDKIDIITYKYVMFKDKWTHFQLYHGENELLFNEMIMMFKR